MAAVPLRAGMAQPAEPTCEAAAMLAERQSALPSGLLTAIGQVESGRSSTSGGWPWTINAAGQGYHFDSRDEAIRAVQALQARGVRSIDVGCFQINLMYHPAAFASLEHAFDPAANARYAATFLNELQARTGSWDGAIGAYHSATSERGGAYRARVFAAWTGSGPRAGTPMPGGGIMIPVLAASRLAPAAGTLSDSPSLGPTPSAMAPMTPPRAVANGALVWVVASQTMGMRVWTARDPRDPALPVVVSGMPAPRNARR